MHRLAFLLGVLVEYGLLLHEVFQKRANDNLPLQIIDGGQMVICPYAILSELKEVGEACHGEDFVDVGTHADNDNAASLCLGIFQNIEENTQSAGRNIFQFITVEHNIRVLTFTERLQLFLGLG